MDWLDKILKSNKTLKLTNLELGFLHALLNSYIKDEDNKYHGVEIASQNEDFKNDNFIDVLNDEEIKASTRFRENEQNYCKLENNKKTYIVRNMTNDRNYFVMANNEKDAIKKIRDFCNKGVEFNIPYLIPYTLNDFYVCDLEKIKKEMLTDLKNGCGCGIEII